LVYGIHKLTVLLNKLQRPQKQQLRRKPPTFIRHTQELSPFENIPPDGVMKNNTMEYRKSRYCSLRKNCKIINNIKEEYCAWCIKTTNFNKIPPDEKHGKTTEA